MSRATDKIHAAARAKGYDGVLDLEWEPIGRGAEKEGPSGGWFGWIETGEPGTLSFVGGYSWQEVVVYIERWIPPSPRIAT